jgi:predicted MFS family arabinose efflux permease
MAIKSPLFDIYLSKTRIAYTWTRILNTPFWALYTLLPFIMFKDLQATSWQIACIISLKPIVSLFSLYWSSQIKRRRDRLKSNIVWASIFGHLPFLFVPWISHPWFFIFASAFYMLFHRGVNPAWMEVLKVNVPEESRKTVFAYGSAVYHVGGALLAIMLGWFLDEYYQAWRWLFPLTALFSLGSIIFQAAMPVKRSFSNDIPASASPLKSKQFFKFFRYNFREQLQKPWKDVWDLIKQRPDFARFQIGFMLGGGGLMLWQPALPQFFFDTLHLNYKELTFAMTLCKSTGYALALPLWTRAMNRIDIFRFSGAVTAIATLFPLGLMVAQWNLIWLYAAYLLYGMMQAGSEMSWNLSGPIFSKQDDSSTYTEVNVVSIGLRGCIAPPLGSFLCNLTNATMVLLMGGCFCMLATWQMYLNRQAKLLQPS